MSFIPSAIAVLLMTMACGQHHPSVPREVDVWARRILAMPVDEVCTGTVHANYFCAVRDSLITDAVRDLGARSISVENLQSNERYIDLDWGGGHVEAYGVIIGPVGWTHVPNEERKERRIRDAVFSYDTRM
jgi:hypothetical protein